MVPTCFKVTVIPPGLSRCFFKKMRKLLYATFLLFYAQDIYCQNNEILSHFQFISNKVGLLSENIRSTLRDRDGFLWLGSAKGLSRFDGKHFIHFTSMGKKEGQDVIATVNSIEQDEAGNIWIAHKEGISRLNPKTFEIKYYNPLHNVFENHRTANCAQVIVTKQMGVMAGSYWGLWVYETLNNYI